MPGKGCFHRVARFHRIHRPKLLLFLTLLSLLASACTPISSTHVSPSSTNIPFSTFPPVFTPTPYVAPSLQLLYRSGQTFITWKERTPLDGEVYRIYRSSVPITLANLASAVFLAQVGRDSARFYANRFDNKTGTDPSGNNWLDRFVERYVITNFGIQVPSGTGLLVWTLSPQDFAGELSGLGYYAATVTSAGGSETLDPAYTAGPISEAVADPQPVQINSATNIVLQPGAHVFIQYMNLRSWNPTFHAPNLSNRYYGVDPGSPGLTENLQYAYDYVIVLPQAKDCGGSLPANLPVIISLHGARNNTYYNDARDPYLNSFCAYTILPFDVSDTWYFGFAQDHDYREGGEVAAGDTIVNYTEQRVLRMLYDLIRKPLGPAVDQQRVYVVGQSMGGSGALAFAERYPNVFAAAYASQPLTDPLTAGVTNVDWVAELSLLWGSPSLNLPVSIDAPNQWAGPLQDCDGIGVWDWQDYQDGASATALTTRLQDEMAPVGIDLSTGDKVIDWTTQGAPTYLAFEAGLHAWAGRISPDAHLWQYYHGLPPALAPFPYNVAEDHRWVPFWNLHVIRDETVPGLSNLDGNYDAAPGGYYNQTILWSSSWNPWDGAPVDQPALWQISLCPVAAWSVTCGTGLDQSVDITPRRLQHFTVTPGDPYDWQNQSISDGEIIAHGTITANSSGLLTIPAFQISGSGNRLIVKPHP